METNKNFITIKSVVVTCIFLLSIAFVSAQSVYAQSKIPMQVAPSRQEIELDPGGTGVIPIRFFNLGTSPLSGIIKVGDFVVDDLNGTPRILEDAEQRSPRFSGASWVTLPIDKMSIAPQDQVSIQAKVVVPPNARPGGRYVAIYFEPSATFPRPSAESTNEQAGLGVSARIAGLVFIKVAGPVTEKALISRLGIPEFQEYGPINVEAEISNRGDYHVNPRGSISLINMTGGIVDQQKLTERNIFPDSARSYLATLGKKWMFGKYTISVNASYGQTGQVIKRSSSIIIFPWKIVLAVMLALLILLILIRIIFKSIIGKEASLEKKLAEEHSQVVELQKKIAKRE